MSFSSEQDYGSRKTCCMAIIQIAFLKSVLHNIFYTFFYPIIFSSLTFKSYLPEWDCSREDCPIPLYVHLIRTLDILIPGINRKWRIKMYFQNTSCVLNHVGATLWQEKAQHIFCCQLLLCCLYIIIIIIWFLMCLRAIPSLFSSWMFEMDFISVVSCQTMPEVSYLLPYFSTKWHSLLINKLLCFWIQKSDAECLFQVTCICHCYSKNAIW